MAFKNVRNVLLINHSDDFINDDEFVVLYDLYALKNLHRFAKPVPVLSMITNQMIDYMYNFHENRVLHWNHEVLSPANLQTFLDTVTARGAPLPNCFGFIDGTVRPISRPGEHQRLLYNGHKRVHALKC